jgi:hypothetical protein
MFYCQNEVYKIRLKTMHSDKFPPTNPPSKNNKSGIPGL